LAQVLCHLPKIDDERLIVGLDTSDDAAVYQINETTAIIQSLDFFTPVVDDPYLFGQIAASNSLSDIYAMGGEPKLAMNIVCFPDCLEPSVLTEILKGGQSKVEEAGAILVGGHSISDNEPKYGLSVTGFVHPNKVYANNNAKVGDVLILTKPLGLGIINTAIKGNMVNNDSYKEAIDVMITLNKYAKDAMDNTNGINSVTDITGFGLLGHGFEMAESSNVSMKIFADNVPIISNTLDYAKMGLVPAGAYGNKEFLKDKAYFNENLDLAMMDVLFDPQTSGGLLISIEKDTVPSLLEELGNSPTEYAIIGEVIEKDKYNIFVE